MQYYYVHVQFLKIIFRVYLVLKPSSYKLQGEGLIKFNQLYAHVRAHDLIPRWKPNLRNGLRRAKC